MMPLGGSCRCVGRRACAHPPRVPGAGSPPAGAGLRGARSRRSTRPPGAPVHPVGTCPIPRDGRLLSRLGGLIAEGEGQAAGVPAGHRAAAARPGALPPGRRAPRGRPRAPRSGQQGGPAEARQALSAERDAYKPRAAILSLLSGLPFPSPGAQCVAVAAASPLALPLLGRPPGRRPGAAREVPSGKRPPAPASPALAFSLPPPP